MLVFYTFFFHNCVLVGSVANTSKEGFLIKVDLK